MINTIKNYIRILLNWFSKKHTYLYVEEIPDKLLKKILYIARDNNEEWLAAMKCPCGCEEVMYLNLISDTKPCWKVSINKNNYPTLKPSVWRQKNCKSHFFLIDGFIKWAQ